MVTKKQNLKLKVINLQKNLHLDSRKLKVTSLLKGIKMQNR